MKNKLTFISLYFSLIILDLELSKRGFSNLFERYSRKYPQKVDNDWVTIINQNTKNIEEVLNIMNVVCAWYPRKADCIHKTFLTYKILRKKYKIPVEMVVGVRKIPFEAHAWIQLGGNNLIDSEQTDHFKIILSSSGN